MNARPKSRGVLGSQDGAAAVEFALIAGLLLMLVFGIMEFGRVFSELGVLNSAAREGARAAAVRGSEEDVIAAIRRADDPYEADLSSFEMSTVCGIDTQGDPVTVEWEQPVRIEIPFVTPFIDDMHIQGAFRCE